MAVAIAAAFGILCCPGQLNAQAPGGVSANLGWWFKGDAGVSTTGSAVTTWNDFGPKALHATQATAANRPTYTALQNFNPVLTFDGSNDYLRNVPGLWKDTVGYQQINTFIVSNNANAGGVNAAFGEATPSGTQTMFAPYLGNIYYGFWGGNTSNTTTIGTINTPYLWSGRFKHDAIVANRVNSISRDGRQLVSTNATAAFNGNNSPLDIGGHAPNSWYYNGQIAEMIQYKADLTAAQRQSVWSYLAIKWGLTLDQTSPQNYTDSDGNVIWDATANSGYKNNIAGIGTDFAATLEQKQSQSVTGSDPLIISIGNSLTATSAANPGSFGADQSYLLWGNDAGTASFSTVLTGFAGLNARMGRLWRVDESGTVANVLVALPAGQVTANTPTLIVSTDASIAAGDQVVAMVLQTFNGVNYWTAAVNFTDGNYFTFGGFATLPGGVGTNLAWWFQGDKGVTLNDTIVSLWKDYSPNALDAVQTTVASQPLYADYQNFNPLITFDGTNDYLRNAGGFWKGTTGNQQINTFIVGNNKATGGVNAAFGEATPSGTQTMFLPFGANIYYGFWGGNTSATTNIGNVNTAYLWSGRFRHDAIVANRVNSISRDGQQLVSTNATAAFNGNNSPLDLGGHAPNGWYYNGKIAEMVQFNTDLTAIQRQSVWSYLAIKWGLTLDQTTQQNYTASDGTVIWNATTNATHKNNIAGLGRDDLSGLVQKQSRSVNTTNGANLLIMSLGTDLVFNNTANNGNFSADKSYLIWGDDDGAPNFATPLAGFPGLNARMGRSWRVDESGTVGTVLVAFTKTNVVAANPTIIVSTDATFAAGDVATALTVQTFSGVEYYTASINFADGAYFTLGGFAELPGGVGTNLVWWYR
ncbi:MAG: hypothetical protein LH618_00900, partial [Saprospiraceae bacterium]|nr:hypothetical protein [Saprospiraceae bacterium]